LFDLEANLETCDPEIQNFVTALKAENLKLHKQIAKLRAEKVSLQSQITVLTEEYAQYRHNNPPFDPATATEEIKRLEKERQQLEKQMNEDENNPTQQEGRADMG
jgi:uncharacterized coiled-coil DUF342 family protein